MSEKNYKTVSAEEIETKLRLAIIEQIPTARLRELAEAERNGTNWIMPCKRGNTVYRIVGQKGKKRVEPRTVLSVTKYDTLVSVFTTVSDILGNTVFLTQSEATRALAATEPKGDAK